MRSLDGWGFSMGRGLLMGKCHSTERFLDGEKSLDEKRFLDGNKSFDGKRFLNEEEALALRAGYDSRENEADE